VLNVAEILLLLQLLLFIVIP